MKRNIESYLPLPLLLWRTATQPFWYSLEKLVDLVIRIKLRQLDIVAELGRRRTEHQYNRRRKGRIYSYPRSLPLATRKKTTPTSPEQKGDYGEIIAGKPM